MHKEGQMEKMTREHVAPEMILALLNTSSEGSVGERLQEAQEQMARAVQEANTSLDENPLAEVLARYLSEDREGTARVRVDAEGYLVLEIQHDVIEPILVSKKASLVDLRKEALSLGVDPTFYKGRIRLQKAIDDKKAGREVEVKKVVKIPDPVIIPDPVVKKVKKTAPPKKVKTPPKKAIPIPFPDDDDDDLDALFATATPAREFSVKDFPQKGFCSLCGEPSYQTPSGACCDNGHGGEEAVPVWPIPKPEPKASKPLKQKPRPRRATPTVKAPVMAKKFAGRSLSALVANADNEVDMGALMAKPTPEIKSED